MIRWLIAAAVLIAVFAAGLGAIAPRAEAMDENDPWEALVKLFCHLFPDSCSEDVWYRPKG
ncbi:MAG: hypothetical protein ABIH26_13380 [Candidatus Eisenbacteria bacterium]